MTNSWSRTGSLDSLDMFQDLLVSKDNPTGHNEREKRGRQKRWEDNIKEWTGMDFASSIRAAEKRTRLRDCCEFICGAPTTFQGYEIARNK